uniref:Variant surface glycoprotein 1125.1800 n=1 Tax=Trypanosoma brucei TaxID=5691 RepID=A0A1J0R7P7_9TRYP|nr:variant surface glycoprotein 1125.1800 [Trypanosoma brucei]
MALATDMLCICLLHATSEHNVCTAGFTPTQQDYSAGRQPADADQAFKALTAKCQIIQQTYSIQELPHLLTSAVAAIKASMGSNHVTIADPSAEARTPGAKAFLYGRFTLAGRAPTCSADGSNPEKTAQKGICIDYSGIMKPGADIPWLKLVHSGINQLQAAAAEATTAISLVGTAQALEAQMESLLLMKSLLTPTASVLTATSNQPSADEQNKCARFNNNETDCKNNDCDYEKTNKKCKTKTGTETTAAGAGEKTGKKCSDYSNQQECEKANDGISAGKPRKCGWIGDDKSGGDKRFKFRYSSFPVNKKFTMKAADFVSLVAF